MIHLHLLRHADAGEPAAWEGDDALRPLSDKGRRQAERLASLLSRSKRPPGAIITSPKARAEQTARIVADALGLEIRFDERLAGPMDLEVLAAILEDAGAPEAPALVGHDPDFSDLASELTGAPLALQKGSLARIDLPAGPSAAGGLLRWLVPPDFLGR